MRILAYGHSALATPFGTPLATRGWCEALAVAGADVTLVADEATPVVAQPDGVRCLLVPHRLSRSLGGRFRSPVGLGPLIRGADVVVIHGAWRPSNVIAAKEARRLGVPYIATPHGLYDPHIAGRHVVSRRGWWLMAERRYLEEAAAVHLFFRDEARIFSFNSRLIIAPNGMEPPPTARWDGGSSGDVVWIGRFDPDHKGLDLLIEAMASIPQSKRPRLRLIGHDWLGRKAVVRALVADHRLEDWISVDEPVLGDEKWRTLSTALAFVYPSRWEAFGLSVAEAVSIGVPTIVTPFPLGRVLAEEGAAFQVSTSPLQIASALTSLPFKDFDPAIGPRVIREHFSWEATAKSWLEQAEAITTESITTKGKVRE